MTPAICLTFDDLFVENRCAALPVFAAFGARVTFCVSHLHTATHDQIAGRTPFHQTVQQVFVDAHTGVSSQSSYHVSAQNSG